MQQKQNILRRTMLSENLQDVHIQKKKVSSNYYATFRLPPLTRQGFLPVTVTPYRSPVTRYRFLHVTVIRHRLLSSASTFHCVYSCLLLWDSISTCSYTTKVFSRIDMSTCYYTLEVALILQDRAGHS